MDTEADNTDIENTDMESSHLKEDIAESDHGDTLENTSSDENMNNEIPKVNGDIEQKKIVSEKIAPSAGVLNLSMTAKEMREIILSRKKKDSRKERRKDMRRRVEMVEAM